jgi:hypothetical protein
MPKYVDLTPTWTEILPTWRRMVEAKNSAKRDQRDGYNLVMGNFWEEMDRMAQAADQFSALITYLDKKQGWKNDRILQAIAIGRECNELERNTIKESQS